MQEKRSGHLEILSVVHAPGETDGGGTFEERVAALGHAATRWVPPSGDPPPAPEAFDAIMVFGGATHPDEDARYPWLEVETGFLRDALARRIPLLGVCLGSQLIARAAGADVHRAESAEIGWYPVALTEEGVRDPVLGCLPQRTVAFQWHEYAWRLPEDGHLLATSPAAPQAFRLADRTWGVQFHPEVSRQMVDAWAVDGADDLPSMTDEYTRQTDQHHVGWAEQGAALLDAFLAEATRLRG
jgi:GMP synthase (glutamine-hydrolysing)